MDNQKKSTPKHRFPEFNESWELKSFEELTKLFSHRNNKLIDARVYSVTNSKGFVLQTEHFDKAVAGDDLRSYKIVSKDTYAYNPARINVGSIARFNEEIGIISSLYVCFSLRSGVFIDFFDYLIQLEKTKYLFRVYGEGGVRIYLWYPLFSKIKLATPDFKEQRKIASFLQIVDKKIHLLNKKVLLLKKYKKGIMQKIFSQEIRFCDENGKEYPEWEQKMVEKVISFIKDGTHGTHIDEVQSDYLLLSAKNIKNGNVYIGNNERYISKKEFESIQRSYKLIEGDILLTIVGTIGSVAVWNDKLSQVAFQRSVAFLRFSELIPKFAFQLMNAFDFQKELLKRCVISAQPGIYLGDIRKIKIKYPNLEEQKKIANFLSSIDDKIDLEERKLSEAKKFKKFLLQNMFV